MIYSYQLFGKYFAKHLDYLLLEKHRCDFYAHRVSVALLGFGIAQDAMARSTLCY